MKVIEKDQNTIIIDEAKGIVTKTVGGKTLLPEWFENYKKFQETNPYVVKVYELINPNTFTMEYVPNVGTLNDWLDDRGADIRKGTQEYPHSINRKEVFELFKCLTSILASGIQFSETFDDVLWLNEDIRHSNILVCNDGTFKIIDPDSWCNRQEVTKTDPGKETTPHPLVKLRRSFKLVSDIINDRANIF